MRYLNLSLVSGLSFVSVLAFAETRTANVSIGISPIINPTLSARAKQIVVDQTADSLSGSCKTGVTGQCNLRAAIKEALAGKDKANVILSVDSIIDQGEIAITPAAGQKLDLTIKGQRGMKNITGVGSSRLFQIAQNSNVQLEYLTISKFSAYDAGAIINAGTLSLKGTILRENKASCFATGAMTAYTTCSSGAISNSGKITLGDGTLFEDNESNANASTASYTTSSTSGGAISSSGTIILDGVVAFNRNSAIAAANSGYHPMPNGGASATASGGAIANFGGTIKVSNAGKGKCVFAQNDATATASTPYGTATTASIGGAVASTGGTVIGLLNGCNFQGNSAVTGPDTNIVP
jgi:hypothetical protein